MCALSQGVTSNWQALGSGTPSLSLSLFPRGALSRNVRAVSPQDSAQSASASVASKPFHGDDITKIDGT